MDRNLVSNYEEPNGAEVAIDHDGTAHPVKAFVYDAAGFKGVWTTDDTWIPSEQINDVEAQ